MDSYSSSQVALCCVINDSQVATFASQSELQNAKRASGHSKRNQTKEDFISRAARSLDGCSPRNVMFAEWNHRLEVIFEGH
ncbi:hypothetical protein NPIL_331511 [Nephila pilipes]|uniref:Uncharacterized protein n=1 Tax=Nephila pilipes TaxID=299642 RepID=A0A8X6P919_NEPPI|nr:hypothetical protein NPIL_331511 [Nephila pilipes]